MLIPDPSSRHTPEYHKKLERRALRQSFGSDYPAVEWLEQLLERLNAIPAYCSFEDKDYDDLEKARHILRQLCIKAGFDPGQPRVPAGNSDGGEWTDTGGGSGAGTPSSDSPYKKPSLGQRIWQETFGSKPAAADELPKPKPFKTDKATDYLHRNLSKKRWGDGNCAKNVANAIRATEIPVDPPPPPPGQQYPAAKDYGRPLEKAHFPKIAENDSSGKYPPRDYRPQKGDVVVIQPIPGQNPAGHMGCMMEGSGCQTSDRTVIYGPIDITSIKERIIKSTAIRVLSKSAGTSAQIEGGMRDVCGR
jgi:hypothetical protein